jgi:type II secretory pathway pseudopilin PulG
MLEVLASLSIVAFIAMGAGALQMRVAQANQSHFLRQNAWDGAQSLFEFLYANPAPTRALSIWETSGNFPSATYTVQCSDILCEPYALYTVVLSWPNPHNNRPGTAVTVGTSAYSQAASPCGKHTSCATIVFIP